MLINISKGRSYLLKEISLSFAVALCALIERKCFSAVVAVGRTAGLFVHILFHRDIVRPPLILEDRVVTGLTLDDLFMGRMGEDYRFYAGLLHALNLGVEGHIAKLRICGQALFRKGEQSYGNKQEERQEDLQAILAIHGTLCSLSTERRPFRGIFRTIYPRQYPTWSFCSDPLPVRISSGDKPRT